MTETIKLRLPGEDDPGILLFGRRMALFNEVVTQPGRHTVAEHDEAMEWLIGLVLEPANRDDAKVLLYELSASQLGKLFSDLNLAPDPKV